MTAGNCQACGCTLRAALAALLDATDPYEGLAAPHEELFSGRDLRNFETLVAAREDAHAALLDETSRLRDKLDDARVAIDAVRHRLKRSEWVVCAEIERILTEALGDG